MASTLRGRVVFLSAFHDYRTKKRASVQQVAEGARDLGHEVWFVSTRYSLLSKRTRDSRLFLDDKANRVDVVDGINCYLWKTPVHPFASRRPLLNRAMAALFGSYAAWPSRAFDDIFRAAAYVVIESSVAAIFLPRIHRLAPEARIIYYATDRLDTVGAHPAVQRRLVANAALVHHACLRSPKMAEDFDWARGRLHRATFGMRPEDFAGVGPTPYGGRRSAVSVGSMLFDRRYFEQVPAHFPDIDFHVIGCGETFEAPPNVVVHAEMPFRDTLPYVKHATIGVAPYRPAPGVEYLAESSLKMAQYELFALPAVCPSFAVGENDSRSGYESGDETSMVAATTRALSLAGTIEPSRFPTWQEVADRVLHPELFPEIWLG